MVPEVAGAVTAPPPPVDPRDGVEDLRRAVAAAVVDEHQLEVQPLERRAHPRVEGLGRLLLVVQGRDDAQALQPAGFGHVARSLRQRADAGTDGRYRRPRWTPTRSSGRPSPSGAAWRRRSQDAAVPR